MKHNPQNSCSPPHGEPLWAKSPNLAGIEKTEIWGRRGAKYIYAHVHNMLANYVTKYSKTQKVIHDVQAGLQVRGAGLIVRRSSYRSRVELHSCTGIQYRQGDLLWGPYIRKPACLVVRTVDLA